VPRKEKENLMIWLPDTENIRDLWRSISPESPSYRAVLLFTIFSQIHLDTYTGISSELVGRRCCTGICHLLFAEPLKDSSHQITRISNLVLHILQATGCRVLHTAFLSARWLPTNFAITVERREAALLRRLKRAKNNAFGVEAAYT
jgi:hypothetical protein